MSYLRTIVRQFRRPVVAPTPGMVTDAELLARFVEHRDEAAFELLVYRHGPMILSMCERLLTNTQDAEDAFQAAFFTLARKAGSIGRREAVGSWLYRVAHRICLRARALAAVRSQRERPLGELGLAEPASLPTDELSWRELRPILDEEVSRLPKKYRAAFILCYLEGKTNEEAAAQLGCPKGTILSRLSRARERLRDALSQRGLSFSAEPLAELLRQHASTLGTLAPVLVAGVVQTSVLISLKKIVEGIVTPQVAELMEGVAREFSPLRARFYAFLLVFLGLAGTASGVYAYAATVAAGASEVAIPTRRFDPNAEAPPLVTDGASNVAVTSGCGTQAK